MGAATAFRKDDKWVGAGTYLGKNKEVFNAEVFAIVQALDLLRDRHEQGQRYTIFLDSQAALSRVQHDRMGPGQALARQAISAANSIVDKDNSITLQWTPAHMGIEGNE